MKFQVLFTQPQERWVKFRRPQNISEVTENSAGLSSTTEVVGDLF